mgnify:CR=1 FL=1
MQIRSFHHTALVHCFISTLDLIYSAPHVLFVLYYHFFRRYAERGGGAAALPQTPNWICDYFTCCGYSCGIIKSSMARGSDEYLCNHCVDSILYLDVVLYHKTDSSVNQ